MAIKRDWALTSFAVILIAAGTTIGTAKAGEGSSSKPADKTALGEDEVKRLVLLMDQNESGKVSEQQFLKFMKAEFDRLDQDKSGELDVKKLKDSQVRVSHFSSVGK